MGAVRSPEEMLFTKQQGRLVAALLKGVGKSSGTSLVVCALDVCPVHSGVQIRLHLAWTHHLIIFVVNDMTVPDVPVLQRVGIKGVKGISWGCRIR